MHHSLTLMAFACGAALAAPAPGHAIGKTELPLPARTIFQLEETNTWFENIVVRRNGDLLVTMLQPNASVYSIHNPLSDSPEAFVINIEGGANGLLGISETSPDVFVVVGGTFEGLAAPIPGTMAAWEVNLKGPKPTTRVISKLPDAAFLNGVITLPHSASPAILVADSGLSKVWRVDLKTGAYETAIEIPEMQSDPTAALPLGINGLQLHNGALYFSNSNQASVYRISIDREGFPVSDAVLVATFDSVNIDDFIINDRGDILAATNFQNTVDLARAKSTGISGGVVVVGAVDQLTVAGDTALAFDHKTLYAVTGGALARPVNGTVTEPGKIVAIDRSCLF